jgi:hypothetical protein
MQVDAPQIAGTPPPTTVAVSLLVRQGGRQFRSLQAAVWRSGFNPENSWLAFPLLTADPEGFRDVSGSAVRPDFSATGDGLRFGFEVTVGVATPTAATYLVDLDDVEVIGIRSQNLPPGLAFDPSQAAMLPDGSVYRVLSRNANGGRGAGFPMIRVGDRNAPLTARGTEAYVLDGATVPEPPWSFAFAAGEPTALLATNHSPPTFCAYVREVTLESVDGGTVYTPNRSTLVVLPADPTYSCFIENLARLFSLTIGCGPRPAPIPAAAGAPEDALGTLRAFRDTVMAPSSAGRYYRELYAAHSSAALDAVVQRPTLVLDLARAWEPWITGAAAMVGGNGSSVTVTPTMLADLRGILDGFKIAGAPAFSRAISQEEARLGIASWAGLTFAQVWQRVAATPVPTTCAPDAHSLCLNGGRYRVEADWRKPDGERGRARAVSLTGASGYFWFFDPTNVEILTKVLDGCGVNDHTWSFSAGLTNLEVDLFVQDTLTGLGKHYNNAAGTSFPPILDTEAIACTAAPPPAPLVAHAPIASPDRASVAKGTCVDTPTTLCLDGGRFAVEASWTLTNGTTGPAFAAPLTDNTGTFWFFREDNVELVVKVLDACSLAAAPRFWVFAGGTTNVGVELRVLDTATGVENRYQRGAGAPFTPILDTDAFATCSP